MNYPQSRQSNIVTQELENEVLIYDLITNKAYCLNETSAMIWQMCDGKKSVTEISQSLTKKLKQPITEDVIWLALDGFKKDNLLENNDQFEINFNGMSRRQVIRKIGFASMIALPLIASVVAPSAAAAQSGGIIALLGACPPGTGCLAGLTCVTCTAPIGAVCPSPKTCCKGTGSGIAPGSAALKPSSCGLNDQAGCNFSESNNCCSGSSTFVSGPGCPGGSGGCICN